MNRDRAKELLPIIEAFANGEDIQKNDRIMVNDAFNEWYDTDDITGKGDYRIKPKPPREFWLVVDSKKAGTGYLLTNAENAAGEFAPAIRVREILE